MAIGDLTALPSGVANAIQKNLLARQYLDALRATLAFSREARKKKIASHTGQTLTFTQLAELPVENDPVPLNPAAYNGLGDAIGLDSPESEQFSFTLAKYGRSLDVNLHDQKYMIADYVLEAAERQGRQAGRTHEALARKELRVYRGGNTVITADAAPTTTACHVDDVSGFRQIMFEGKLQNVSNSTGLKLHVANISNPGQTLIVTGVTPDSDGDNISSAKSVGGRSGVLTYETVGQAPAAGDVLKAVSASVVIRPNGRNCTQALQPTDIFNTSMVMAGKQHLASRGVRPYKDGWYRCIIPPTSMTQLYADPDFKLAAQGCLNSAEFRYGQIVRYQGVEYIESTESTVQAAGQGASNKANLVKVAVNRPILLGDGALWRGDAAGLEDFVEEQQRRSAVHDMQFLDGIAYAVRSPIDRLGEILSMSWQTSCDYCCPSDQTTTPATVGTSDGALYKKAVQFEHAA